MPTPYPPARCSERLMRPALRPLTEQVVLITGASSGIGLVTARTAAARGAKVMLVARNATALREAVALIEISGGTAAYAVADVGILTEVQAAAEATVARFGRIDTWVNNAGVAIYADLVATPMDEHERLIRTNYFGAVHGALTAVAHLREAGGALITVGSIVADFPTPIMGAYAASKAATQGYIDSLRMELIAAGIPIAVTLVKPSGTSTPIARHAANHVDGEGLIPPPVYDPSLVAEAILDAAVKLRREVTVGGIGRLQALAAMHFPGLYAHVGKLIAPLLSKPGTSPTPGDNLADAGAGGIERSAAQPGRPISLYAYRRPAVLVATAGGVLGIAWSLYRRRGGRAA